MATTTNPFNYLSALLSPAAFAGQQAANPGLWNIRPELFGTTEGPQQQPQQQQPFDLVGMTNAQNQGKLDAIRAVGELQAQEQARKDSQNQALINQKRSQPGFAWDSGFFKPEQLKNPALEAIPNWARAEFVNTPAGMQQALGVSNVQNPYVNPNSVPSAAPAGVFSAPIMEQQRQDAGGLNNVQVGKGAWTNNGQLVGFSDVGDGMASRNMASAMRIAQSPWANWSNMIGKSNEAMQDPAILAAMRLKNPAWTPIR